jgi:hypothetical protein
MSCDVPVGFLQTVLFQTHKGWRFELSLSHLKRFLGVLAYSLIILACVFISHETQQKQGLADSPGFGLNQLKLPFNPDNQTPENYLNNPKSKAILETKAIRETMVSYFQPHPDKQKNAEQANPTKGIPVLMGQSVGVVPTGLGQSQL